MERTHPWPTVSVVIPVRDGAAHLQDAIRSALGQEYPGSIEIVVADGGSTDGSLEIARDMASEASRVAVVANRRGTTPAGLNVAIAASRGEVVVRCDAQAALPSGYVRRAVEILEETGADVVGGVQAASGVSAMQRAIAVAMTTPLGAGGSKFRRGGAPGPADTVYLGVFRRRALERVGLFDEAMVRNQDYELNHRIRTSGGEVFFHPDLRVPYRARATLGGLWRQYLDYGIWKWKMLRRHPGAVRARQLAPPMLVFGLFASAVLVAATPWRRFGLVVPAAYGAVLLATAAVEAGRRRDPAVLLTPAAMVTMHVAWGVGFLLSRGSAPAEDIPLLPGPEKAGP
ncbi:MAG: glycosyltransferase family 2 protein [Acidimicrobiia bacterium]